MHILFFLRIGCSSPFVSFPRRLPMRMQFLKKPGSTPQTTDWKLEAILQWDKLRQCNQRQYARIFIPMH
jgi:hypothetical protein